MYYKFSRLAKFTIVFTMILNTAVILLHSFNTYRMIESNKLIIAKMEELNVLRDTAIRYLQREGHDLFVGGEFATLAGIVLGLLALFSLYKFAQDNSFFFAIAASFFCLLTTFVGGLLLFYVIFSGKSEVAIESEERTYRSQWEQFISRKSNEQREDSPPLHHPHNRT